MEAFLILNGYELRLSDDGIAEMFEKLGAGEVRQAEFFELISRYATAVAGSA